MDRVRKYILCEAKVIKKECYEKHISPQEWVTRYAQEYHRRYWNKGFGKRQVS